MNDGIDFGRNPILSKFVLPHCGVRNSRIFMVVLHKVSRTSGEIPVEKGGYRSGNRDSGLDCFQRVLDVF